MSLGAMAELAVDYLRYIARTKNCTTRSLSTKSAPVYAGLQIIGSRQRHLFLCLFYTYN